MYSLEITKEEMYGLHVLIRSPRKGFRHEIRDNHIQRAHTLEFAMHHTTTLLVQGDLEEERLWCPVPKYSLEMCCLCPKTRAVRFDSSECTALRQF